MIAFHVKVGNQCLRALQNGVGNEQASLLALVVVIQRRSNLHIQKAVRKIKSAYRIRIVVYQPLAETAVRTKRSGLKLQPALQQTFAEILVAGKADAGKPKLIARSHFVADHALPARGIFVRAYLHVRVEVPLSLKVIPYVPPAFLQ